METKILSSGSSSKDRDKLVPAFRQSYLRNPNQYQDETQMGNGVCLCFISSSLFLCNLNKTKQMYRNRHDAMFFQNARNKVKNINFYSQSPFQYSCNIYITRSCRLIKT